MMLAVLVQPIHSDCCCPSAYSSLKFFNISKTFCSLPLASGTCQLFRPGLLIHSLLIASLLFAPFSKWSKQKQSEACRNLTFIRKPLDLKHMRAWWIMRWSMFDNSYVSFVGLSFYFLSKSFSTKRQTFGCYLVKGFGFIQFLCLLIMFESKLIPYICLQTWFNYLLLSICLLLLWSTFSCWQISSSMWKVWLIFF